MTDQTSIDHALSLLIHEHGSLTGPEFMAACERTARAYFDDVPGSFDADAALAAITAELESTPSQRGAG